MTSSSDEETEEDGLEEEEEEEELKWSSVSEDDDELNSDGSEYEPAGRNAQRAAKLKRKWGLIINAKRATKL